MEKLYNLIHSKEVALDTLKENREKLQHEMANPRVINENAQEIENTKRAISLLCDALDYAEETSSADVNPKDVLGDMKDHLEEMKQDAGRKTTKDLEKDIGVLNDIMDKDLDDSEQSNTKDSSAGTDESSTGGPGQSTSEKDAFVEDVQLPDFDDF